MPLHLAPCRKVCTWLPTGGSYDGLRLFACTGCGSEWVRTEPWTPRDWDVTVPEDVRAELDAAAADTAGS